MAIEKFIKAIEKGKYKVKNNPKLLEEIVNNNIKRKYKSEVQLEKEDSIGGVIYIGKIDGKDIYDAFLAKNIEGQVYLIAYVQHYGRTIVIPNIIQSIGKTQRFLDSNGKPLTLGRGNFNAQEFVEEITLEKGSNLECWDQVQFMGQNLLKIDFQNADKLKFIGNSSFAQCEDLKEVLISRNVNNLIIYNNSFNGANSLNSLSMLEQINTIGDSQFKGTRQLTGALNKNTMNGLGDYQLCGCGVQQIKIDHLHDIGYRAISFCEKLKQIDIGIQKEMTSEQIYNNPVLTDIHIKTHNPKKELILYTETFKNNPNLETLNIPENVELQQNFITGQYQITSIVADEDDINEPIQLIDDLINPAQINLIALRGIKLNTRCLQGLDEIEVIRIANAKGEIPSDFVIDLPKLFLIEVNGEKYLPNRSVNPRIWLQLKFQYDSGYTQKRMEFNTTDQIKFIHSQSNPNVMLCVFEKNDDVANRANLMGNPQSLQKSLESQIFVRYNSITNKSEAIQILDNSWRFIPELLEFQKEIELPNFIIR